MNDKHLEDREVLCPYLKKYWAYSYSGDKKYVATMETAEVIEEEMQPCIKEECIFYTDVTDSCRKY